jgi:hypothetical protein
MKTITAIENHACEMCAVVHSFIVFDDKTRINMPAERVRHLAVGDVVMEGEDGIWKMVDTPLASR